jgi:2-polyprenyl-6-methoxyphenol hydroxylase-like FAD-dependent oxidoreductase
LTTTFRGQSGVGGFISKPIPDFVAKNNAMVFTFGRNGFFGYSSSGPISAQSLMWWSTFETFSLPHAQNLDVAKIKADLVERHKHWKDPIVQSIIQDAEVQSIYPTWVLPELPHWGENGIVLVGDAAHAMDPTTGQGASQALEDSQTLALLLARLLEANETTQTQTQDKEKAGITLAIKLYYKIRNPRVQEIVERGKKISGSKANVGIVAEYFMYFFLWMMMRYPAIGEYLHAGVLGIANTPIGKIMLGDVNRKLYAWSAEEEIEKELRER